MDPVAISSLIHFLWRNIGGDKKPKPAFETEQEAYEFCQKIYRETGGITPELRRAYEFYLQNISDDCRPGAGPEGLMSPLNDLVLAAKVVGFAFR